MMANGLLILIKFISSKKEENGFTLIELILVLMIFGILCAIAVPQFSSVTNKAKQKDLSYLAKHRNQVIECSKAVRDLYKNMDDSLRFKVTAKQELAAKEAKSVEKDFRGVGCPMNFVKTKLVLETMQPGQQLSILLDDGAPIQNVPNSVKLEGHKILKQEQQTGDHWQVVIEKI